MKFISKKNYSFGVSGRYGARFRRIMCGRSRKNRFRRRRYAGGIYPYRAARERHYAVRMYAKFNPYTVRA